MNKKTYLILAAILLSGGLVAGAVLYQRRPSPMEAPMEAEQGGRKPEDQEVLSTNEEENSKQENITVEEEHVRGNPEAPVTIVVYSDFQCSYCARFHSTLKQALGEYPDQIRWVHRHFPLGFHADAQPAAEAAECAGEQGKFWEFTDSLFENQSRLGDDLYSEIAQNLGLDESQFESCLSSGKYEDKVLADAQAGKDAGVRGTPGSFINGESVRGAIPYPTLKSKIESALSDL